MAMELSYDLVEDILSWVPAKSLLRLKYSCKQWKVLISEPRFINKHLSHMHGREQQFTVFNNVSNSQSLGSTVFLVGIDFNELNEPCLNLHDVKPLPSSSFSVQNMFHCDGLLLFVMRTNLLVLNPLLEQARWIKCGYKFDYSISMDAFGLVYISNNQSSSSCNDYRMVRFRCGASDKGSRIEVYEFKTDCWRVVVDKSFDRFLELLESSVCLRGTPY